jgi:AAA family ATP:ADP antiporter
VLITMLVLQPVFGWIVARWPRRTFLPWVYGAFALQLAGFAAWALLAPAGDMALAQTWFVWLGVFNLFVVSVFWGFMADLWAPRQAHRLYGAIGVGGTAGAVAGGLAFPQVRALLAPSGGPATLAVVFGLGALVLLLAVAALTRASAAAAAFAPAGAAGVEALERRPVGGGAFDGFLRVLRSPYLAGIALLVVCYVLTSTWGWSERLEIVKRAGLDEGAQGDLSAYTESAAQALTLVGQLLFTGTLLPRLGVRRLLAFGPLAAAAGFAALATAPSVATAVGFLLLTRAVHFAFAKPAQEALFSVVERGEKYKAKSFLDTFVYRLSDWGGLETASLLLLSAGGTRALAVAGVLLCGVWLAAALALGRAHAKRLGTG